MHRTHHATKCGRRQDGLRAEGNVSAKLLVSMTVVCLMAAGCAYGVQSFDDGTGVKPKPDAGATKDAGKATAPDAGGHDAGTVSPEDSGTVDPPDTGPLCSLSLQTGLQACDDCLGASCCTEDNVCGQSQDCGAFLSCINACLPLDGGAPDQSCVDGCSNDYPQGAQEFDQLSSCMQSLCSTECQ